MSASATCSLWIRPTARELDHFNWGSTLWHEFTHVITLQMTDNKVPRWFSEGLSVFEERKAYPGWGDDMKLDYLKVIKQTAGQTVATSRTQGHVASGSTRPGESRASGATFEQRSFFPSRNSTTGSCIRSTPDRSWCRTTRLPWWRNTSK